MARRLDSLGRNPDLEPEKLRRRFQKLLDTRRLWEPIIQELANYLSPETNDVVVRKAPGVRRTEKLFDSTPIFASELLASSIHGTLTSNYTKWFSLVTPYQELNDDADVATWLDSCGDRLFLAFTESNFSAEAHQMYNRLVPFGTGCVLFEEKDDRKGEFIFTCIRFQDMVLSEGADGRVNAVYRSLPMSRSSIVEKWPDAEKIDGFEPKGEDPDKPHEVLHCVVPVKDKRFKWASVYFLSKFTSAALSTKGYREFPYMVPRWSKEVGETYGRGRGHTALPDVKTLNKMVELELRALGKVVNPPMKAKGGDVIGQVKLNAGGVTTVRDMESLQPLFPPLDYQPVNLKIQELRNAVKQMFYADQLQLPDNNPQMTATEANIRYELMQRVLGPALGRIETEWLDPVVSRGFQILMRAGKFDPPPAKLRDPKYKGMALNVKYQGPLAKAQQAAEVQSVQQFEQVIQPIVEGGKPEVLDNIDMDGLTRYTAAACGIPRRFIKDKEEVDQKRQEQAQQQQSMQEQQAATTAATAAGKVAPLVKAMHGAPEQGSMMDQAQQAQQGQGQNGPVQ